ncbi:Dyp-type peroxidase [Rhodanobacter aciditrophus]|uniref:Dyp-type peroxidase n=1 Tax=Rhodanobacter aciditrophus TaxID=1623218 RepID=A0ABW4AY08_9GAMM
MTIDFQTGIVAEPSSDATFILLNAAPGKEAQLRKALSTAPALIESIQQQFPDTELHAAIGFSCHGWERIMAEAKPAELAPFPSFSGELLSVSDEAHDIVLHIRSMRHDATHTLALKLFQSFADSVTFSQQTNCFKYLDNRDFTGFVDGTENPQGEDRKDVALVGEEDSAHLGGSYLNYMKFTHNLAKWNTVDLKDQEDTYGRTKYDNEEYASADKSVHAHTKRTSLKDDNGNSLEILRHSMPFGDLQEQGLVFASYSRTPSIFDRMLQSMIEGDEDGNVDHLMKYTNATAGSAFFIPSISFLKALA